ncbi:hypothetical protein PENSPDRAFT_758036 [Peniophora sp. CONT]|nr:hypothetical protein PENSPDRAFT_758036 [Peniophora sp. CONT]
MSLERLPSATRAKLRSAQLLTSVPQAVSELLQNALDAGARHVEIGVDASNWECWVRDDGEGISRDGLASISSGRYHTSKAYEATSLDEVSTFGFRGEALASAADISCIEIVSRTARSRECRTIIMKNGKCLYDGPSSRWRRDKPGTVVCLRDMFYNLPIRRTSHPSPAKTLELIRKEIELYAVVFPEVSFKLEDTSRAHEGSSDARLLSIPKTATMLAAFRAIHGRALAERVQELNETLGDMTISGFISVNGALSKSHQYIYVNRHPISPNHLHHVVNSEFSRSTFGRYDPADENDMPSPSQAAHRRSPRKSERKPVYVLNISLPPSAVDNCVEPAKTAVHLVNDGLVAECLTTITRAFLLRHEFAFGIESSPSPSPSPRKRRKIDRASSPLKRPTSSYADPDALPEPLYVYPNQANDGTMEDKVQWRDPSTGNRYLIDSRTGNSYPADDVRRHDDEDLEERARSRRRTLALDKARGPVADSEAPAWLTEALKANAAYKLPERRITAVPPATQPSSQAPKRSFHSCAESHVHALDTQSTTFDRADLLQARVLAQVDCKFVLLALGEGPGSTLALLDQHAASERVRVERLLGELCEGKSTTLNASVPVLLAPNEARVVRDAHELLARWGLVLQLSTDLSPADVLPDVSNEQGVYEQVLVSAVPEVVNRKLLMPGELSSLLKSIVADLGSGELAPPSASQAQPRDEAFAWKRALRSCPKGLIDLVNSRACRGAIMFNDTLTPSQCKRLVTQLAETAFPFRCAHGRPSLAPLARLGDVPSRRRVRGGRIDWAGFARGLQ